MTKTVPFNRQQRIVLLVCVAIFALGQFHRASGSVFTPILIDRFAVSASMAGGLVSAMFFATILAQMPFGVVLDKTGPRRVLGACILIIAAGTALFALAARFDVTLLSRILIGLGMASMGAATHVIIARNFPARDFGYVGGLVVTLGGIGGLMGTYPLAFSLTHVPWPLVFGVVAALTLLLAFAVFRALPASQAVSPEAETGETAGGYLFLLRQPEFLKVLTMGIASFAPITTVTGLWGGPFLQDALGFQAPQAGAILLMLFGATIAAGYVYARLDRGARSRRRIILGSVAISASCLFAVAMLHAPPAWLAISLLMIMVFCQQFYIPLAAHMRRTVPDNMLGRASTLMTLVSVAAIPLMQIGFGAVLDLAASWEWSKTAQFRAAFGCMGVVIALCGLIYSTARRADEGT